MTSLFEPLAFRTGLTAPNRLALAPMTNLQSNADGSLHDDELRWLVSRARGGFGTVMTCASHVARDGQGWKGELGCFDDTLVPGLTKLASALRAEGAISLVQLFHGGLRADAALTGGNWSALPGEHTRAATEEDCTRVIAQFAAAAARVQAAGFDGVELHGAHGYLFTQFLTTQNTREDRWGGALENRARLLREALRAVRAKVGPRFTVGVRLSAEDFGNAKGLDLDESLQVGRWLVEDGADFLHLSLWRSALNSRKRPEQHVVDQFRAVVPAEVKLFVAGAVWERTEAEALLARGADVVAVGRAAVANPDWAAQVREPSWKPRRPPLSIDELMARGLNRTFAEYMRIWPNFVSP